MCWVEFSLVHCCVVLFKVVEFSSFRCCVEFSLVHLSVVLF
jgi:hypothetical protein